MKKYLFVYNDIKDKILNDYYPSGSKLPTEDELCSIYDTSKITIQRALAELASEGMIKKRQGKGSFVLQRAGGAANQKKRFITLILVNTISSLMNIIEGIDAVCTEYGYSVMVSISNYDPELEKEHCRNAIREGSSGIIIFPIDENINVGYFTSLVLSNFPIVFIDKHPPNLPCSYVRADSFGSMYHLTNHVIMNGHRVMAFIADDRHIYNVRQRYAGFRKALADNNIEFKESYYISEDTSKYRGHNVFVDYSEKYVDVALSLDPRPTCLVCSNDLLAINIISKLWSRGYSVPKDFSVTGFDNLSLSNNTFHSLTTVNQDFYRMGVYATQILLNKINKKETDIVCRLLSCDIVKRTSLAPYPPTNEP